MAHGTRLTMSSRTPGHEWAENRSLLSHVLHLSKRYIFYRCHQEHRQEEANRIHQGTDTSADTTPSTRKEWLDLAQRLKNYLSWIFIPRDMRDQKSTILDQHDHKNPLISTMNMLHSRLIDTLGALRPEQQMCHSTRIGERRETSSPNSSNRHVIHRTSQLTLDTVVYSDSIKLKDGDGWGF